MARKALLTVLSAKFKDSELLVLDQLKLTGAKTRELSKVLGAFPKIKSALVILPKKDDDVLRASANLPGVKIITTDNLNIFDILKYQNVILTKDVVDYLQKTYGKKSEARSTKSETNSKNQNSKIKNVSKVGI